MTDPHRPRRFFRLPSGARRVDEEVDDEVVFHLERKIERLISEGYTRAEAEAEALRRFGDLEAVKDQMRRMTLEREGKMRMGERMDVARQNVRYGLRQLLHNRMFSVVAVATLMLGIGATTAIFSVVDGVLFQPLPYEEPDELVAVWLDVTRRGGPVDEWPNYPDLHDLEERSRTLESIGLWGGTQPTLTGRGEPEQLLGARLSYPMFSEVVPVEPALGRGFTPEDDRPDAPPVALISHGLWERAFGGDESVVGSTMDLNGRATTVVGVMPRNFRPPFVPDAELWMPLGWDLADNGCGRGGYCVRAIARMTDGTTLDAARTEAVAIGDRLASEYPETNIDQTFHLRSLREDLVGPARAGLLTVMGAAALVLLIACVNVANLLLARGTSRHGELAVRSALGAGRSRLVWQLLVESLLLAVAGGVLGLGLAYLLTDVLVAMAPEDTPRIDEVTVNVRALAFALGATLLSGLGFGSLPALRSVRTDLHAGLREGGRGSDRSGGSRARSVLVVAQVALALVLLVGAGLLVRTFQNLRTQDMGFRPAGVLTMRVGLPSTRYEDADALRAFYPVLLERMATIPGVQAVGATSALPLVGFDSDVSFQIEGRPIPPAGQVPAVWFRRATSEYLDAMGIPVLQGRGITDADRDDSSRVVVVNETFARRYFPDEDAIGKRITFGDPTGPGSWREIVGVTANVRHFGMRDPGRAALYLPFDQAPSSSLFVVLRSERDLNALAGEARAALAEVDPLLAAGQIVPLQTLVRDAMGPERLVASLLGMFALLALVLAVVGLYGVVSYNVNSRLREMGVRLALGASGGDVGGLVVRASLGLVFLGLAIGGVVALALSRLMENLLYGVTPTDPVTFAGVAVILAVAGGIAAAVPAIRAARVDPVRVLSGE